MSEYSIEHTLIFNTAKRILRFVCPDFRVVARGDLKQSDSNLDLRLRMLEVPEGDPMVAAGMIIFNAGILMLEKDDRFRSVFGVIPKNIKDDDVIIQVAKEHSQSDEIAYEWARQMMLSYFPEITEKEAERLVDHRVGYEHWLRYFSK